MSTLLRSSDSHPPPGPLRRALPWMALVALMLVAQSLLVALTINYEGVRALEQVEATAAGAGADIRQRLARNLQNLQSLLWREASSDAWRDEATSLLRQRSELLRIEVRDDRLGITDVVDSPYEAPVFTRLPRAALNLDTELACTAAQRLSGPAYSRSYFVPLPNGLGVEVIDLCLPLQRGGELSGYLVATTALTALMRESLGPDVLRAHEVSFVEGDRTRLARAGAVRGAGVYVVERLIDLPGQTLQLRVDSAAGAPRLIPNLAVALVLGLSLALGTVVLLLVRDTRRRAAAESALAESLAFRKAMEDSLITGLRARDLQGRVTYANPAFCKMVGFSPDELQGRDTPPYWPPELVGEYSRRQSVRLASRELRDDAREGFETTFMRRSGERFPVLIFEAPLVDGSNRHTGWMSAVLDVSAQRRIEDLSRLQQERLQATARLATVGEMASLLSHELNQPLAAIASYATGSLNLMQAGPADGETAILLKQAAERIAEQAERAGRVIKSVHDFVRRREQAREPVRCDALIEGVLPLVRLQARKTATRVTLQIAADLPRVVCDRTMVEQVLLNLTRNGIQAMEAGTQPAQRELTIGVERLHARWVSFSVRDHGPGVSPEVAERLFTPFFTTRSEGMGLGLSLCRTVIEQHGGTLDFSNLRSSPEGSTGLAGTCFTFTLPAEPPPRPRAPADVLADESTPAAAAIPNEGTS